jgi:arylsulfatase A-like enzyme
MIWAVPGMAKGERCQHGVDLMSIYPTICELAGAPKPEHVEGISIKPLLQNPSAKWTQPGLCTMYKDNHTLVTADWRYIRYADGSEELYNRNADPREWTNVVAKAEFASVKKEMARYLPKENADSRPSEEAAKKKKKKAKAKNS